MKFDKITRWMATTAMYVAALLFIGSLAATLGHMAGLWPAPNLDLVPGLPNLPTMAMTLFLAGMFGLVIADRIA